MHMACNDSSCFTFPQIPTPYLTNKKPYQIRPPLLSKFLQCRVPHFPGVAEHYSLFCVTFRLALCLSYSVLATLLILLFPKIAKDIPPLSLILPYFPS